MENTLIETYHSLKEWRKAHGFTQEQAAAFIGISWQTYGFIERRVTQPRAFMLKKIIDKTGVSLDAIIGAE